MEKTLFLKRHATIDIYLYTDYFRTREVLTEPDTFKMSNMHHMPLLDFDMSEFAGKKIVSAELEMTNLNDIVPYEVDVSTVTQKWDEKYATYYNSADGKPWSYDGWLTDVIMSAGNSVYFREHVLHDEQNKTVKISVPPAVLTAMANGQSFGFALLDARSRGYIEADVNGGMCEKIFSANSSLGAVPKLTVIYEDYQPDKPEPVSELSAMPVAAAQSLYGMTAQLNWVTQKSGNSDSMYYRIYMSTKNMKLNEMTLVDKFATPNIAGSTGLVGGATIENLMPETKYYFAVEVCDGLEKSEARFVAVNTLNAEKMPDISLSDVTAVSAETAFKAKNFTVGVTDDITKVNPLTGEPYVFGSRGSRRTEKSVNRAWETGLFDGEKIYIPCVKGEKVAFQLVVSLIDIEAADFKIKADGDFTDAVSIYKTWCVPVKDRETDNNNWYPEVAVPVVDSGFSIPFVENKIPGQKSMTLFVDVNVKENAKAGCHNFNLVIQTGEDKLIIPVLVEVAGFALPRGNFILELNGYTYPPGTAGYDKTDERCDDVELSYYQLGYEHYGTVNILGYNHNGEVKANYMPKAEMVNGEMHVVDWTVWDEHFSKYLDGSYTEKISGRKVPISHIYLPLHENWPMSLKKYYKVKVPEMTYPEVVNEHMRLSDNCYKDFREGYREGIKSVICDFIRHFDEKGWHHTEFQFYLNNKHFYKDPVFSGGNPTGICWWLLDEPHFKVDWHAIEYFASILREAQAETQSGRQIKFRADLSCFNHAFDTLDGVLDSIALGGLYAKQREDIPKKRNRIFGEDYWPYGGWSDVHRNNMNSVMWVLDIYSKGCKGIVPWNNYGNDRNYENPNNCAILYPGKRFGMDIALASLRLKAGRKAMELTKYLDAFKKAFGYSEKQMKQYMRSFVDLDGTSVYLDGIDAGRTYYKDTQNALERMRVDMLRKLIVRNMM